MLAVKLSPPYAVSCMSADGIANMLAERHVLLQPANRLVRSNNAAVAAAHGHSCTPSGLYLVPCSWRDLLLRQYLAPGAVRRVNAGAPVFPGIVATHIACAAAWSRPAS